MEGVGVECGSLYSGVTGMFHGVRKCAGARTVLTVCVDLWAMGLISGRRPVLHTQPHGDWPHLPKPETIGYSRAWGQPHSATILRQLTTA